MSPLPVGPVNSSSMPKTWVARKVPAWTQTQRTPWETKFPSHGIVSRGKGKV